MDLKTKITILFLSLGLQKFSHFGTLVEILGCSLLLSYLCNPPCSIFFFFILTISSMDQSSMEISKDGSQAFTKHNYLLEFFFIMLLFSCSIVSVSVISWTTACQASQSFTISQSLCKLMSIKLMMPPNHLILCHPLLFLPSIFLRVLSNESALYIRGPKYWSFSFSSSNE